MSVKARMVCSNVNDHGSVREVFLHPIYDNDPKSPNHSFSKATPQGKVQLMITNPDAFNQFEPQAIYDVDFTLFKRAPTA